MQPGVCISRRHVLGALTATGPMAAATSADWTLSRLALMARATEASFRLHMQTANAGRVLKITVAAVGVSALGRFCKPQAYQAARSFRKRWRGRWAWVLMLALGAGTSIAASPTETFERSQSQDTPAMMIKTVAPQRDGIYEPMCAAGWGTDHAFMPIIAEAVSAQQLDGRIGGKQLELARAAAEPASDKTWSLEELKARGETVFLANCAVCHQAGGEGIPGTFPALKGSKITTGPVAAHLDIVLHGSNKNPIMPAWGKQMNDLDLASVITYERNAWGNNTGDVIEPADVRAAR